jgi:Right handed beta helix region
MKSFKCIFLILLIPSFILAQGTINVSGIISNNTQWNYDTVYLTGDLFIPNNISLSIAAGTKIVAKGYFKIDVKGRLIAIGEPNKFIYFTTLDTARLIDITTSKGGWNGLHFESITTNNDSSILRYCRIQFGKAVGTTRKEQIGGGILIDSCSKIRIQNCEILDNIAAWGGGGIQLRNNASPKIIENFIRDNYTLREGAGIASLESSAPIIQKNIIIENACIDTSGGVVSIYGNGIGGGMYLH